MGAISYGWNNLKFRKESKLLLLGQAISLTGSIFAFLLAGNFTDSLIRYDDVLLINTTLTNRYASFVIIIALLSFISALSFYLLTLRTLFQTKKKDIALMLAVGGLIEKIQDRLISEIMIIAILSNLIAIFLGNILFFGAITYISILKVDTFIKLTFNEALLFSLVFSITFFVISYIFASYIVIRSVKQYYSEILSGEIQPLQKIRSWALILIPSTKANKIVTKLARLNFNRTFNIVKSHLFSLILLTAVISSVVFGSYSIRDSTIQAMNQGVGSDNLYVISYPELDDFIEKGYSLFSQTNLKSDFLNYTFSESTIKNILLNEGIPDKNMEFKLISHIPIKNSYTLLIDNNYNYYSKEGEAFLIGQSMNGTFSNWQYFGENPKTLGMDEIAVGESVAWDVLNNPLENMEELQLNGTSKTFVVKSMLIDPFLKGRTVYVTIPQLMSILDINYDTRNLGLVKIESLSVYEKISALLGNLSTALQIIPLQPILDQNSNFQRILGNIVLLIIFPTILAYMISIISYSTTIIDFRRDIFHILKSIGGNKKIIKNSASREIWGLIFWGFFIGTLGGLFFIFGWVIPEPIINVEPLFIFISILFIIGLVVRFLISYFINKYYETSLY